MTGASNTYSISPTRRHHPRQYLVVMVKRPVAGQVKTRLCKDIGVAAATNFYRHTLGHVVARVSCPPQWQTVLAVAPDHAVPSPSLPLNTLRIAQGPGDLGQRMHRVMTALPPGPLIIIGSDCPSIDRAAIARAFDCLGANDAVIGPSPDGGYWLIGLKRFPTCPDVFQSIRWSSPMAYEDTRANMQHLRVAVIDQRSDVDTSDDLTRCRGLLGRRILPRV